MTDRPRDDLSEDEQLFLHKMYQENFDDDFEKWVENMEESLKSPEQPSKDTDFELDF